MAGYIKNVSLYVSTNTLLAIAINRYIVVRYPLRKRLTVRRSLYLAASVWLVSLLVALPTLLYSTVVIGVDLETRQPVPLCIEHWPRRPQHALRSYNLFLLVAEFVLPMAVMTYCYVGIARRIWQRLRPPAAHHPTQQCQYEQSVRAKRRTYRRLIIVLVMFVVCWAPYYAYIVWREFFEASWKTSAQRVNVFYVVEGVSMSNAMVNAVISVGINNNLQLVVQHLKETIDNIRHCRVSFRMLLPSVRGSKMATTTSARYHPPGTACPCPHCPGVHFNEWPLPLPASPPRRPTFLPLPITADSAPAASAAYYPVGFGAYQQAAHSAHCAQGAHRAPGATRHHHLCRCTARAHSSDSQAGECSNLLVETPERIKRSRSESDHRGGLGPI